MSLPSVRKVSTSSDKVCSLTLDVNESTSVFTVADIGVAAAGAMTSGFVPITTALVRLERLENTFLRVPAQCSLIFTSIHDCQVCVGLVFKLAHGSIAHQRLTEIFPSKYE